MAAAQSAVELAKELKLSGQDGKEWGRTSPLQKVIRRAFNTGMMERVRFTIEFRTGFELFNTRPYHNYETWSSGFYATISQEEFPEAKPHQLRVQAEDLDTLILRLVKRADELRPEPKDLYWEEETT